MKSRARWPLPVVVGIAVLIQFVPVTRSNPPVEGEIAAAPDVRAILKRACYDCHSHETAWPLYSAVAPVSWVVAHDVREGRAGLNFSAWNRVPAGRRAGRIGKICEELAERDMPPWYYPVIHRDARLSTGDREQLVSWAERIPR